MSQWITLGQHASFMDKDDLALFCVSSKAKKKKKNKSFFKYIYFSKNFSILK